MFYPHLRTFFIAFREEGRERNIDAREKHQLVAFQMHPYQGGSYAPGQGIKPATQVSVLTGNQTTTFRLPDGVPTS